jgi:CheY-like chemotaxis protein/two-component sensor histidine kinase
LNEEFLAVLAHELRNPLAPMRLAVEMLRMNTAPDPHAALDVIDRQIRQMTRLVDELMDVARIARHRIEIAKDRVELTEIMHQALDISLPALEAAGHRLTVKFPADPVNLTGDAQRLAQVFSHLLDNAAKYMTLGGHVSFIAQKKDGSAVVTVRDAGVGIASDALPHVFDLYTSVRGPDNRSGGLGVELALVKELVELHGGTVTASSAGLGKGSEFVVTIPLMADARADRPRPVPSHGDRESHRILVVDDLKDTADSLAMLLRVRGNNVSTAYDGHDAIAIANEFHPEVVVLDIGLPGIDGYETAKRMRREEWARNAIFIAVTGWGQEKDRLDAAAAGFDHHFVKPVRPAELASCWQRLQKQRGLTPPSVERIPQLSQRILVVDDQPDVADSIASVLRYLGADVGTAYDGRTALATIREFRPSIVFVDIHMPGMSGLEVARELRSSPEYGELALIAVTGWEAPGNSQEMRNAGFDHSLTKPTDLNALEELLASVARGRPRNGTPPAAR